MRHPTAVQLMVIVCAAEIFSMVGLATFAALLPTFVDAWALSKTDAGWINGIYFAGYLLSVPVLVSLTDRMPPRRIYLFCMALSALGSLGFAMVTDGFWSAMIFRAISGVGLAGTYMPGLKLLTDLLEKNEPGRDNSRAVAFYTSSFGVGTSLSYLMAGELTAVWGWQVAFGATVIGPVIAGIMIVLLLPGEDVKPQKSPDTHLLDFRPVLRCKLAMAYVLAYTVHNFELFAYRSWVVAFLVYSAGTNPDQSVWFTATAWAAIFNLFGLPASVLGNELSRRIGRHRAITLIMWASATLACILGFSADLPFLAVALMTAIYGILITGESSSVTAGVIGAAPRGYRGATMAVHSCIGFMGSFAGPLMFGVMLDLSSVTGNGGDTTESWGWAFVMSGAVVALGPLFIYVLGRRQRE